MTTFTPHQLTSNVKLLQKIVLEKEGKILLLQRDPRSASRPNCWDFPGGNSEWPTGLSEPTSNLHQLDASREVEEETGILVSPNKFTQTQLKYFETFFDPEKQIFTILLGWYILLGSNTNEVRLSEEHTEFVWVEKSEALNYDFGGAKGAFLPRIIKSL